MVCSSGRSFISSSSSIESVSVVSTPVLDSKELLFS
jgi:hypothetical protein